MARLWEQYKDCKGADCRVPLPADLQTSDTWLAGEDQHARQARRDYDDR